MDDDHDDDDPGGILPSTRGGMFRAGAPNIRLERTRHHAGIGPLLDPPVGADERRWIGAGGIEPPGMKSVQPSALFTRVGLGHGLRLLVQKHIQQ
jgi:hypothetical protein